MKKLIILIAILIQGCGFAIIDTEQNVIITSIKEYENNYCYYYGEGNNQTTATLTSQYFCFKDSCGKFQIGDTIKFTK